MVKGRDDAGAGELPTVRRSQSVVLIRRRAAEASEKMARVADTFADYLETAAERGDREHRLRIAAIEREIAGIERRNAARLRRPDDHTPLEPLPDLPWAEGAAEKGRDPG